MKAHNINRILSRVVGLAAINEVESDIGWHITMKASNPLGVGALSHIRRHFGNRYDHPSYETEPSAVKRVIYQRLAYLTNFQADCFALNKDNTITLTDIH